MDDELRARIALHRHYSDQLMNHSRNLFALAVSLFTGVVAYGYIVGFFPEYPSALFKDWFSYLLIVSVSGVSLYFFGRIYFYGNLTRNVLAVKRDIGKGLRIKDLGISTKDWKDWFDTTALDEIDCATLAFFLHNSRTKIRLKSREFQLQWIYLISGEFYNIAAVVSTVLTISFFLSLLHEFGLSRQAWPESYTMFCILLAFSVVFWLKQYDKVKSTHLEILKKAEDSIKTFRASRTEP